MLRRWWFRQSGYLQFRAASLPAAITFRVVKQLWGFTKVRYSGLAKNLARAQTMFALANLYQARRQLLPARTRCAL